MANFNPTVRAGLDPGKNPKIYNLLVTANVETAQALTEGTKQLIVKPRTPAEMKVAFVSGETASNYITVPANTALVQDGLSFSGTIYVKANKSVTIEILEWS